MISQLDSTPRTIHFHLSPHSLTHSFYHQNIVSFVYNTNFFELTAVSKREIKRCSWVCDFSPPLLIHSYLFLLKYFLLFSNFWRVSNLMKIILTSHSPISNNRASTIFHKKKVERRESVSWNRWIKHRKEEVLFFYL